MITECLACVNPKEPDITQNGAPRITLGDLRRSLALVNATATQLRAELRVPVCVFVASDTALGQSMAHAALGGCVLQVEGRAVVSARTHVVAASKSPDGLKVAADFVALALCDVVFSLGSSALSENAAAMGFGVWRSHQMILGHHGSGAGGVLQPNELASIRRSLSRGGARDR